ncbi:hypothetical protein HMI55_001358 [Coelomomyces lativittatus]|nr:hypothetical protein HMI55_001358 [Coelomomyces lativittatus]
MGLKSLSLETLKKRFQVTEENPLVGIESRWRLLKALGNALETHAYFQSKTSLPRPGNFIDTLPPPSSSPISLSDLWPMFISLYPIPPSFPYDMGYCPLIQTWVPLHKLTQWLTYTYVEVLERFGYTVMDQEGLTGLAEYRNGGLFLDTQVITWTPQFQQTLLEQHPHPHPHPHLRQEGDNGGKKRDVSWVPVLELGHPAVLEWRACTVVLLDKLHALLNQHGFKGSLAKVLEAGTWKAGRAIAKQLRPETGAPPIQIISDGTVF